MQLPFRTFIIAGTFSLSILLYVDRVCIAIAGKDVATDLNLDKTQMGWIFAAFSLGYALFQTPGGWLADRLGPRRVLSVIVVVWSIFTGLSSIAWSFVSMLCVRFLFGAGEAGAFPGVARAIHRTRQQSLYANDSSAASVASKQRIPWLAMLQSCTFWALCGQYFASNFTFYYCLTWFFPELKERFGLTGWIAGFYASAPLLFGAVGNWFAGWWVDHLYRINRWKLSRRLPAILGFLLSAIGLIGCVYATTPLSSSLWFSLSIFGADMTLAPSWSSCIDIGGRNAGSVSGTMNMAGNLGSFVTAIAYPYLSKWLGSSIPFLCIAAGLNLGSVLLWMMVNPTRSILTSEEEPA